jgi:hypothetical protein
MAESTFAETVHTLRSKIARQRGFPRAYDTLSTAQKDEVEEHLLSGLRNFYWPKSGYVWSFMRPIATLATVADQWQYEQPGDFGGIEGDMTFSTSGTTYTGLSNTGENVIRDLRQKQAMTGIPRCFAVRPLAHHATGQRFEIILFPTPDAVYTLEFTQIVNPNALTDANPFPYGGPAHAETILESCLACAESNGDEVLGVHATKFNQLLQASILLDGQLTRADNLGPNLDRSGDRPIVRDRRLTTVSYNGVTY